MDKARSRVLQSTLSAFTSALCGRPFVWDEQEIPSVSWERIPTRTLDYTVSVLTSRREDFYLRVAYPLLPINGKRFYSQGRGILSGPGAIVK